MIDNLVLGLVGTTGAPLCTGRKICYNTHNVSTRFYSNERKHDINISRRNFLGGLGAAGAMGLAGCQCPFCCCGPKGKIALQLYSINRYIGGIKNK